MPGLHQTAEVVGNAASASTRPSSFPAGAAGLGGPIEIRPTGASGAASRSPKRAAAAGRYGSPFSLLKVKGIDRGPLEGQGRWRRACGRAGINRRPLQRPGRRPRQRLRSKVRRPLWPTWQQQPAGPTRTGKSLESGVGDESGGTKSAVPRKRFKGRASGFFGPLPAKFPPCRASPRDGADPLQSLLHGRRRHY